MTLYTLTKAAETLQVSIGSTRRYIDNGSLKACRLGKTGHYRIEEGALREFLGLSPAVEAKPEVKREESFDETHARVIRMCGKKRGVL